MQGSAAEDSRKPNFRGPSNESRERSGEDGGGFRSRMSSQESGNKG